MSTVKPIDEFSSKVENKMSSRPDATGLVPSRTDETIAKYRKRARMLLQMAGRELDAEVGVFELVHWFASQNGRWAAGTVHTYRAAIRTALADCVEDGEFADTGVAVLSEILERKIQDRKGGPKRTSARKSKTYKPTDFARLLNVLNASGDFDDRLAAQILGFNALLFLRPCEWYRPIVEGEELIVQSAKITNGRGLGPTRTRSLTKWPQAEVEELVSLLEILKERTPTREDFDLLIDRLRSRIAYRCERLGIRRLSFYGTRHVGMAAAKRVMTPDEVAASAGHKTARTSTSKYAPRRTGWRMVAHSIPAPTAETLAKVQPTNRWSRTDHAAAQRMSRPFGGL